MFVSKISPKSASDSEPPIKVTPDGKKPSLLAGIPRQMGIEGVITTRIEPPTKKDRPIIIGTASDGEVVVMVGDKTYSYWIDSAHIPHLKRQMLKQPWKAINFLKSNCRSWSKL